MIFMVSFLSLFVSLAGWVGGRASEPLFILQSLRHIISWVSFSLLPPLSVQEQPLFHRKS